MYSYFVYVDLTRSTPVGAGCGAAAGAWARGVVVKRIVRQARAIGNANPSRTDRGMWNYVSPDRASHGRVFILWTSASTRPGLSAAFRRAPVSSRCRRTARGRRYHPFHQLRNQSWHGQTFFTHSAGNGLRAVQCIERRSKRNCKGFCVAGVSSNGSAVGEMCSSSTAMRSLEPRSLPGASAICRISPKSSQIRSHPAQLSMTTLPAPEYGSVVIRAPHDGHESVRSSARRSSGGGWVGGPVAHARRLFSTDANVVRGISTPRHRPQNDTG